MDGLGPAALSPEQIRSHDHFNDSARRLWTTDRDLSSFVQAMIDTDPPLLGDAIWTLAYSLPIRRAVWWACLCAARGADPAAADDPRLRIAVEWVMEPSLARQRNAVFAAEGELETASDWCVKAASMAGYEENDHWTTGMTKAAAGVVRSVVIFAVEGAKRQNQNFTYRQAALLGIRVGLGDFGWSENTGTPWTAAASR